MNVQTYTLSEKEKHLMLLLWKSELFSVDKTSLPNIKDYKDTIDALNNKGLVMILHTELHKDYYHSVKISWDGFEFMQASA